MINRRLILSALCALLALFMPKNAKASDAPGSHDHFAVADRFWFGITGGTCLAIPDRFSHRRLYVLYAYPDGFEVWFWKDVPGYRTICVSDKAVVIEPGETKRVSFPLPNGWKIDLLEYSVSADGLRTDFRGHAILNPWYCETEP